MSISFNGALLLIFATIFLPSGGCNPVDDNSNHTNMIVGGFRVKINDVPYQAGMFRNGVLTCGGSIIGTSWILTSFHCVDGAVPSMLKIVVGTDDPYTAPKHDVAEIIKNPGMAIGELYDAALLRLTQPLKYSTEVKCLKLAQPQTEVKIGHPAYISGFGITAEHKNDNPLKAAIVDVLPSSQCEKAYAEIMKDYMICAGFEQGTVDSCQGDSGGPLVINEILTGVTFFGKGCGRAKNPGIYISVPWIYDWIMDVVHQKESFGSEPLCKDK